jgi:release factor glutamine methyltransferase
MGGPTHIITANPPYISPPEYATLPPSVSDHEDRRALIADEGGLHFYRVIAELVPRLLLLNPHLDAANMPRVALEVGHLQADKVRGLLEHKSEGRIERTECWRDQWDRDRLVVGFAK